MKLALTTSAILVEFVDCKTPPVIIFLTFWRGPHVRDNLQNLVGTDIVFLKFHSPLYVANPRALHIYHGQKQQEKYPSNSNLSFRNVLDVGL